MTAAQILSRRVLARIQAHGLLARRRPKRRVPVAPTATSAVIAYNRTGGFVVPLSSRHRPAAQHVLAGRVWEERTLDFLASNHRPGHIVHAGTYFGDFLPTLAAAAGPDHTVLAFEPNEESYRCAQATIALNGIDNIRLTNAGLGASSRTGSLVVSDQRGRALGGASHIAEMDIDAATSTQVIALDEVVDASATVSLMHLDVEGYETEALAGALRTVERCRPLLVLETVPEPAWIHHHLQPLGYQITGRVDANTILRAT